MPTGWEFSNGYVFDAARLALGCPAVEKTRNDGLGCMQSEPSGGGV